MLDQYIEEQKTGATNEAYVAYNDKNGHVVIEILAPGYVQADFKTEVFTERLRITATKNTTIAKHGAPGFSNEYPGRGEKTLKEKFDTSKAKMTYVAGILKIKLPIMKEYRSTEIPFAEDDAK